MSSFHLRNAIFLFRDLFGVSSDSYFSPRTAHLRLNGRRPAKKRKNDELVYGCWRESARNVTVYAANNSDINANAIRKCVQIACRRVSRGRIA
jgi:hypothetical protein